MLGKNFSSVESYTTCGCGCQCHCDCASGKMIAAGRQAGARVSYNYRIRKAQKHS